MTEETRSNVVSLISRGKQSQRVWSAGSASHRIVFADNAAMLSDALRHAVKGENEVHRLIIDGSMTVEQFLSLLADVPVAFTGDVVLIREEDSYVSSSARGDGRLLYRLTPSDVAFYLEAHDLIDRPAATPAVRQVRKYRAWQAMRRSRPRLRLVHSH